MKVSLNIENDLELKAYIKDLIKGQVLSIVRGELLDLIQNELNRKVKGLEGSHFNKLLESAMKDAIRDILYKEHDIQVWNTKFVAPHINNHLDKAVSGINWDSIVDKLAKEKIQILINK